ncbi:MAG TPA: murein biosynthesis integral membrane protein MurJ [Burkholderiales bacterium]|nr:murein biosynthesis integral membrane protein MurJ [Burkholderiales bacterium]
MNLLKALAAISSMTLLSRILGLIRDAVIAWQFGVSSGTDAFLVAFRLPNLLRRVFAEGAFSQAFVPILSEYRNTRSAEDTKTFVHHVSTLLALVLLAVTVLGILAAPVIVYISAPGFAASPDKFQLTVELLRVIFPYILFISLTSLAGGILNTWSRFAIPAFTPVLLNVSFIVFALWLTPYFDPPIKVLAWAVFAGGMLQLAFMLPFLSRIGMLPKFMLQFRDPGVWRLLKLMGPAIFGVSVSQVSLLINTIFASFLVTGSVTWLYYADRLMELPTGLLGVALGTILLPSLSRSFAEKSGEEFSRLLDWGLRLTFLLALPCAVALAMLSIPLIATLFYHGAFEANDVAMTRQALVAYAVGLLGLILVKVLAPGFYSRQDVRTPVKIGVATLVATQVMNLVFLWGFGLGHAGLALAISLGACMNAGMLFYKLRQGNFFSPQAGWRSFAVKLLVALALMALALGLTMGSEAQWMQSNLSWRATRLSMLVVSGAGVYFAALWALGFRLRDFAKRGVS